MLFFFHVCIDDEVSVGGALERAQTRPNFKPKLQFDTNVC